MFLWIHLIFVPILIILVAIALHKADGYQPWMMMARASYLVFIITGFILFFKAFHRDPLLDILKVLVALLTIGLIEMVFAEKTKHRVTKGMLMSLVGTFVLLIIIGLIVAGGRPFTA